MDREPPPLIKGEDIRRIDVMRAGFVRWVARRLGVPIAVHQDFFMSDIKVRISSSWK